MSHQLFSSFFGQKQLCRGLHILLILLYVTLVVVASQHYEHGLNFPFSPTGQTTMSVVVSVITQTFSTLYLATLVLLIQRLSLIRDLHTRQTLTAIHDKASAWLGLGSSLVALMDQINMPSSVSSVILIGSYLTGIAVLHVTIPASVSVATYNATMLTQQTTQLGRPIVYPNSTDLEESYDILSVYNQFPQIGLQDNMIYDMLPIVPMAVNDAIVNATVFDSHCAVLDVDLKFDDSRVSGSQWYFGANVSQGQRFSDSELNVTGIPDGWFLDVDILTPATLTTSASLKLDGSYIYGSNTSEPVMSTIITVISTIPVVDSSQSTEGLVKINPGVAWLSGPNQNNLSLASMEALVDSVQVFLCNISTTVTTATVSAITRQPFEVTTGTLPDADVLWRNWSYLNYAAMIEDLLLNDVGAIFSHAPASTRQAIPLGAENARDVIGYLYNTTSLQLNNTMPVASSITYSLIDQFLMEDLNHSMTAPKIFPPPNILLSDFQHSLGKAMAAIMWYDRNQNRSSIYSYADSTSQQSGNTGVAIVEVLTNRLRLNFNIIPLAVSLGVSCALLALTFPLSDNSKGQKVANGLNSAGILQSTWLLGNDSRFARIRRPERQELRRAGLFDVQMSAWAEDKANRDSTDCESTELTVLKSRSEDELA